jgi:hypothetical protein
MASLQRRNAAQMGDDVGEVCLWHEMLLPQNWRLWREEKQTARD